MAFKVDPERARKAREALVGSASSPEQDNRKQDGDYIHDYSYDREKTGTIKTYSDDPIKPYGDTKFGSGEEWIPEDYPDAPPVDLKPAPRTAAVTDTKLKDMRAITATIPKGPAKRDYELRFDKTEDGFKDNKIRGYVHELNQMDPNLIPGAMSRWMTSMFTFVPYTGDRAGCYFTIKPDRFSDTGARQIIMYGAIKEGFLNNGNLVFVKGKPLSDTTIRATEIYISTDESSRYGKVTIRHEISPVAVWLLTFIMIGVLAGIIYLIAETVQGMITFIQDNIETVVIILVLLVWLIYRFIRFRSRRWRRRRFF